MKKILIYIFGLVFLFLASKTLANSCASNLKFCNDTQICIQATRGVGKADLTNKVRLEPNRVWSSAPLYKHFVETAKQRGLDCGVIEIEEDCENNPSLCSPSDLCRKATKVSDDGISKVWDTNFKKHVDLAKIKKLQCSVVSKCGSDPSFCSDDILCSRALMPNVTQNVWSRSPKKQMYVRMAKKKSLHCGIKSEINLNCKSNPSTCSDEEICVLSTFNTGLQIRFDTNVWKMHSIEAVERKLSCGINIKDLYKQEARVLSIKDQVNKRLESKANSACVANPKNCSDDELCKIAVRSNSKWDGDQPQYVWEAKQRDLNCGLPKTKSTTRALCTDDPKACSVKRLCNLATYTDEQNIKRWSGGYFIKHVNEAIKRDLNCGVKKVAKIKPNSEFLFQQKDFSKLSQLEKKQMQYALKQLGYYTSSIDGLYGPNTERASRAYAKAKGIKKGYPTSLFKKLISEVNVPESFSVSNYKKPRVAKSPTTDENTLGKFFRGALAVGVAAACATNPGCAEGMINSMGANSSDGVYNSGTELNSSQPSIIDSQNECSFDSQCGFGNRCVKRLNRSICVSMVDSDGRKIRDRNVSTPENQCRRDRDCPRDFSCNRQLRVCVLD